MKDIPMDYQPPERQTYEKMAPGTYTIEEVGISAKSTAGDGTYVLAESKFPLPQVYFSMEGDFEGEIPMSVTLQAIPYVVNTFCGKVDGLGLMPSLSDDPQVIHNYIETALELINSGSRRPEVQVDDSGFGMMYHTLPAGRYYGRITDFSKVDGTPMYVINNRFEHPQYQYTQFVEILGDRRGRRDEWTGVVYPWRFVNYEIRGYPGADGKLEPDWQRYEDSGDYTPYSLKYARFIRKIAPSWIDAISWTDPHNLLPQILEATLKDNKLFIFDVEVNKKGFNKTEMDSVIEAEWDEVEVNADSENLEGFDVHVVAEVFNLITGEELFQSGQLPKTLSAKQKKVLGDHLKAHSNLFTSNKPIQWNITDVRTFFEVIDVNNLGDEAVVKFSELSSAYI